jgi:photosystem II stability/assembly factor-like uncharacterized protein
MRLTQWRTLLFTSTLLGGAWAKKGDDPAVAQKKFDFIPRDVNYFDDSDTLLMIDANRYNAYRSEDAGVSWKLLDGVPEGKLMELVMHPFDNKRAYVITDEKEHYLTVNRGKSWEKFVAESQASIFRDALTFHATDPNRIIFNAMECTGIFCEELVRCQTCVMRLSFC